MERGQRSRIMHMDGIRDVKVIGIDLADNGDVSVVTEGYYRDGILYIIKIEVIEETECNK